MIVCEELGKRYREKVIVGGSNSESRKLNWSS
jgi:hypothetical protein